MTYFLASPSESVIKSFAPDNSSTSQGNFSRVAGVPFTQVVPPDPVLFGFRTSELAIQCPSRGSHIQTQPRTVGSFSPRITRHAGRRVVGVLNTTACLASSVPEDSCLIKDLGAQIDPSQIRILRDPLPSSVTYSTNLLFVADTMNHCIRLLDLATNIVRTVAGICGTSGFMDGPLGNNMMSQPNALGMDEGGNIWIYDKGNSYIRILKIDPTTPDWFAKGNLYTMVKGVCADKPPQIQPDYPSNTSRFSLCYGNWIKQSGLPSEHIFDEVMLESYCTDHFTNCPEFDGVHPLYVGVQIYNKTINN